MDKVYEEPRAGQAEEEQRPEMKNEEGDDVSDSDDSSAGLWFYCIKFDLTIPL